MTKDEARDCDHGRMKGKCDVCDLQAELEATNRQVEILSDALAESRREVAVKNEAIDLALEFVEANHSGGPDAFELIAAIKQARSAQHEPENEPHVSLASVQEPVATLFGSLPVYDTTPAASGCTRSHPHENMDAMCELRTEIARLTNENARLKAQPAPLREDWGPGPHEVHSLPAQPASVQPIIGSYLEKDNSQFKFSEYESDGVHHNKPAVTAPVQSAERGEPVAYAVYHRMGGSKTLHWPEHHSENGDAKEYKLVPLYTTPPAQRPFVGLTDEEVMNCYLFWVVDLQDIIGFYKGIETKLREKNAA